MVLFMSSKSFMSLNIRQSDSVDYGYFFLCILVRNVYVQSCMYRRFMSALGMRDTCTCIHMNPDEEFLKSFIATCNQGGWGLASFVGTMNLIPCPKILLINTLHRDNVNAQMHTL